MHYICDAKGAQDTTLLENISDLIGMDLKSYATYGMCNMPLGRCTADCQAGFVEEVRVWEEEHGVPK
jgi:hypothetical protein